MKNKMLGIIFCILLILVVSYLILYTTEKNEKNIKLYEQSVIKQYSEDNILKNNIQRQSVLDIMEDYLNQNKRKYFIYKIERTEESITAKTVFGTKYVIMPQVEGWK